MDELTLAAMKEVPGLYVFADTDFPGYTNPVVVIRQDAKSPGRMFMLEPSFEVECKSAAFRPTTFLVGGPYSTQGTELEKREEALREQQMEGLQDELEFWKDIALRGEKHMRFAQTLEAIGSASWTEVYELIKRIEDFHAAEKRAKEIDAQATTAAT